MSIKEANTTIAYLYSPKNNINFIEELNNIIYSNTTFTTSNVNNIKSNLKKIYNSKLRYEYKKKNSFRNKQKLLQNKVKDFSDDNTHALKNNLNYKDLEKQIDNINNKNRNRSLSISINKNNQIKLNNKYKNKFQDDLVSRIKNNFNLNPLSNGNINKYYTSKHIYNNKINYSSSISTKSSKELKHDNNYNDFDRKYSYSIKQNSSYISNLLNEEENSMNINKYKNNKKSINKLYLFTARGKIINKSQDSKNFNLTARLLKTMKKSIESKPKSIIKNQKNKKINIYNYYYKSGFINYINNITINKKLNSTFTINSNLLYNNLSSPNISKNKKIKNIQKLNNILKAACKYINLKKEERKTDKFIKDLKTKKDISFSSRFSFDKENQDVNDAFYTSPKSIRSENMNNIILFNKENYGKKRNYMMEKNSFKTNKNLWKTKNLKSFYNSKYFKKDNQKSYIVKSNIIMPVNETS